MIFIVSLWLSGALYARINHTRTAGYNYAQTTEILSIRCAAEEFFRSSGGKLHFTVGNLTAGADTGTGAGLQPFVAQKP